MAWRGVLHVHRGSLGGVLLVISLAWGWLRTLSPSATLAETELIMVAPVPQPVAPVEPEDIVVPGNGGGQDCSAIASPAT